MSTTLHPKIIYCVFLWNKVGVWCCVVFPDVSRASGSGEAFEKWSQVLAPQR